MAVSLDHVPAGPAALTLELEEARVLGAHERGRPGVAEDVRGERNDAALLTDALEDLLEPVAIEEPTAAGGKERAARLGVWPPIAEVPVELAPDRVVEVDRPAAAELAGLGTHGDRPIFDVEVGEPQLAELVEPQAGAGGEDEEREVTGTRPAGGAEDPGEIGVAEGLTDVLVKLGSFHVLEDAVPERVGEDAVLGEK